MDNTKVDCDKVELRRQIVVSNVSLMMGRLNLSFLSLASVVLFSFTCVLWFIYLILSSRSFYVQL